MALKDVKKMCSKFCTGRSSDIVGYTPPTLHKGVRWFVDFSAHDPARGLMRRKRYYITDNLSISAKKHRAAEIMEVLTMQLSQGWNPWLTNDESRGFVLIMFYCFRSNDYIYFLFSLLFTRNTWVPYFTLTLFFRMFLDKALAAF